MAEAEAAGGGRRGAWKGRVEAGACRRRAELTLTQSHAPPPRSSELIFDSKPSAAFHRRRNCTGPRSWVRTLTRLSSAGFHRRPSSAGADERARPLGYAGGGDQRVGVNRPAGQTREGVWAPGRLAGHAADAQSRRRTAPSTERDPGHVAAAQTGPDLASG